MTYEISRIGRAGTLVGAAAAAVTLLAAGCSSSGGGAGTAASSSPVRHPVSASHSAPATASRSPSPIRLQTSGGSLGVHLTDGAGKSLYMFASDRPTKSSCSAACLTYWPALTAHGTVTVSAPLKHADLGSITRPDGTKQVSYAGHPLYYYAGDTKPGDVNGEGLTNFGAYWWLLAPSGKPIQQASTSMGGGYG